MTEPKDNNLERNQRSRNIPLGIFDLVAGSGATFAGGYIVELARHAPILEKTFEPMQVVPYIIGAAGATVATLGLVAIVDGVRTIRGKYMSSQQYRTD